MEPHTSEKISAEVKHCQAMKLNQNLWLLFWLKATNIHKKSSEIREHLMKI
jgi:hypothetical protein